MQKFKNLNLAGFTIVVSASLAMACSTIKTSSGAPVDREKIRQTIRSHQGEIRACYESTIDVRPGAMGKVVAEFDINDQGTTSNIKFPQIDPTIVDIRPCLTEVVSKMKFEPAPSGEVIGVAYPFFFDERVPTKFNERVNQMAPPVSSPGQ